MNANNKYSNTEFIRFVLGSTDYISSDSEKAKDYLSSQGLNVASIISQGIQRVKQIKLKIEAEKTHLDMISSDAVKQKATEWVDSLLNNIDFSLTELVKEEEFSMSFRSIESLNKEDIKNILIKHFTLKFWEEQKKKSNGI